MLTCPPGGMKIFVRENESVPTEETPKITSKYFPRQTLSGLMARKTYESIVLEEKDNAAVIKKPKNPRKKPVAIIKEVNWKESDIFRAAQDNDVKLLSIILSQRQVNVNETDAFGWTALMCAACSGSTEAVLLLLKHGANRNILDKGRNSAVTLARANRNENIVKILSSDIKVKKKSEKLKSSSVEEFDCDACKTKFKMDKNEHYLSTLHIFNEKKIKNHTFYGIPESNRGFQMLLRTGWDRESGLGPEGHGKKYPIKPKIKNNRRGIGAEEPKKTDSPPGRTVPYRTLKKKDISLREMKNKEFQRNFRLEFSS